MLYLEYTWDINSHRILLDEEFDSDKLGWKGGDLFKFVNVNGRQMLIKIDEVEQFNNGFPVNVTETRDANC